MPLDMLTRDMTCFYPVESYTTLMRHKTATSTKLWHQRRLAVRDVGADNALTLDMDNEGSAHNFLYKARSQAICTYVVSRAGDITIALQNGGLRCYGLRRR